MTPTAENAAKGLMQRIREKLNGASVARERDVLDELAALIEKRLEVLDKDKQES